MNLAEKKGRVNSFHFQSDTQSQLITRRDAAAV